jgi:3-carboxy-cis,cis-muconate cycloisomerase
MPLFDSLFRAEEIAQIFSDLGCLQGLLDFEAALARAEARASVIPASAAPAIAAKCQAERFDVASISQAAKLTGNVAIPLIKDLTRLVATENTEAAQYVHWGATSQDAIDTGCVLQLSQALNLISADLNHLRATLARLATEHRSTPIVARTWMQQALPTSLGFKIAGWLDALNRHSDRVRETQQRALALQFGGAVGTLAALGKDGPRVAALLAEELHLALPDMPWHSHRDRPAEVATTLGLCTGTLGKIALDIALHMQTEVAEIREPGAAGRGGSSTMPHKRNPVTSAVVSAAAVRVPGLVATMLAGMPQEQERGLGGWHAEWETLPEIVSLAAGALRHLADTVPQLQLDVPQMRKNLEVTQGLIYAEAVTMNLAEKIGRLRARELVESACETAREKCCSLREVLAGDGIIRGHFSAAELDQLFDPQNYLGAAEAFTDSVVAHANAFAGGESN